MTVKQDEVQAEEKKADGDNNINHSNNSTRKFRYVALDLDGTLLNSEHKISENTKQGIRALHARGLGIIFATGRAISTVYEHIRDLNLPTPLPVVCSNGAAGLLCHVDPTVQPHGVRTETLFTTTVPRKVAETTIQLSLQHNHVSQYYVQNKIYAHPTTETNYKFTEMYKQLTGSETIYIEPDVFWQEMLTLGLPTKQLVLFPQEEQDAMLETFTQTMQDPSLRIGDKTATLVRGSLGWFIEVLHPAVNKGAGLERLCQEYLQQQQHSKNDHDDDEDDDSKKVSPSQVVAFGDGDNDYEFLQVAGWGVVMSNGRSVVKQIADEITKYSNDEDGVLRTLLEMEEEGRLATKQQQQQS